MSEEKTEQTETVTVPKAAYEDLLRDRERLELTRQILNLVAAREQVGKQLLALEKQLKDLG